MDKLTTAKKSLMRIYELSVQSNSALSDCVYAHYADNAIDHIHTRNIGIKSSAYFVIKSQMEKREKRMQWLLQTQRLKFSLNL